MLKAKAPGSKLSRPFSVYKTYGQEGFSVVFKVVGENTKAYYYLKKGQKIEFMGPLGQPIPLDYKENNFILVGGGTGIASLMQISKALNEQRKKVDVFLGGHNESQIFGVEHFRGNGCEIRTITDIGPGPGRRGFVTELLEETLKKETTKSAIIACGPKPMLKKVHELAVEHGNECWVLLEEMMACGYGSCLGCAIFGFNEKGEEEVKHVCKDGPAFNSRWINWDKLVPMETVISLPISKKTDTPMKTTLRGKDGRVLELDYPVMNGSGCLDVGAIEKDIVDISHIGALVTKGIKLLPTLGNPTPRICETPNGIINSIGLEGPGVDEFIKSYLPRWRKFNKPLIANISGFTPDEFVDLAVKLSKAEVKIIEINVSCPNITQGGIAFGKDPEIVSNITFRVRRAVGDKVFIIVKLTPEAPDIVKVAKAAINAGADAISLINTLTGMAIDPYTLKFKIGRGFGGMSGPAIRPRAVKLVCDVASANTGVPVIGMGGIDSAEACRAGGLPSIPIHIPQVLLAPEY
ncbi:dihydroorotate dehydrogenase [Candidatus Falkowbacteria bacterium]|nr:dihydroorotate dehydrogenase [Candidatus Falkowbacteria bacterium]